MSEPINKIDGGTVREDFNAISAVLHYTKAAHFVGLWKSELTMITQHLPDRDARLLEAGCGAGRVAVASAWQDSATVEPSALSAPSPQNSVRPNRSPMSRTAVHTPSMSL